MHVLFTFSRDSWSQAERVLFNSLYILARSCSALNETMIEIKLFVCFQRLRLYNLTPDGNRMENDNFCKNVSENEFASWIMWNEIVLT